MSQLRRGVLALALAACLASAPLTAQAADQSSANKAASWLSGQVSGGALDDGFSTVGASADGLVALESSTDPSLRPTIDSLLATVKSGAASYVSAGGGSAAGKLAIVAAAYGLDPRDFGGVDLVAALRAGVAADGSVGPYPSPFGSGLAAAGFERADAAAPATLSTWLLAQQNADGGFGYAAGQPSDADNTALALVGLLTDDSAAAKAGAAKAVSWASSSQRADGSWAGYVPVNSTCVLGSALIAAGANESKAIAFVKTQQLSSGAITDGNSANVMATSQCVPLLAGRSYLDVAYRPSTAPTASASPSSTATASPTVSAAPSTPANTSPKPTTAPNTAGPTASASATTTATTTAGATASAPVTTTTRPAVGRGLPARTGVEDDGLFAATALAGLLALTAAWAGRR